MCVFEIINTGGNNPQVPPGVFPQLIEIRGLFCPIYRGASFLHHPLQPSLHVEVGDELPEQDWPSVGTSGAVPMLRGAQ